MKFNWKSFKNIFQSSSPLVNSTSSVKLSLCHFWQITIERSCWWKISACVEMLISEEEWETWLPVSISVHLKFCRSLKNLSTHDLIWQWAHGNNNSLSWFCDFILCTLCLIVPQQKECKMHLFPPEKLYSPISCRFKMMVCNQHCEECSENPSPQ